MAGPEKTMRSVGVKSPGAADQLTLNEVQVPTPHAGEVLIAVEAAGINRPDILQRRGFYPPPQGASDVLGLEVAGIIHAAGSAASLKVGTRVMALLPGGGYADYAVADARHVIPIPGNLPFTEAAALPETVYTVWANIFEAGKFTPGDRVLIHGATSGIGTISAAMVTQLGGTAYGTAGSDEKVTAALAHGYSRAFNYNTEDWSGAIADEGGVQIILDMVGGEYVERNLNCLAFGGRHVSIAVQGGMVGNVNLLQVMQKQLTLTGSTLRARPADEKARLTREIQRHVMPLVETGAIRPVIDSTFPLADVRAAHEQMESGAHVGKIVLTL